MEGDSKAPFSPVSFLRKGEGAFRFAFDVLFIVLRTSEG